MCGIAGIALNPNSGLPDLRDCLLAMRDTMTHRGPDDAGLYLSPDGRVGLANRRLAIRDLTQAGHMPMRNADGTVWITYNGEIYNAGELRRELQTLGYTFHSTSDTEVILHGYEAWGESVVERLRGMFAFAIHDRRGERGKWKGENGKGRMENGEEDPSSDFHSPFSILHSPSSIFLARDRLGIKPLYYAQTPEGVVFASELKAVLASGLVGRGVSPAAVVAYLMLGSVPCPLTIYDGVQSLEPGCTLRLEVGERPLSPEIRRYWDLSTQTRSESRPRTGVRLSRSEARPRADSRSSTDAVEQVRALLEEAVRVRLVSDVPLGAFLSGGLDSSSVVALMRAVSDGPIRTCSMIFEEAEYSEAAYARAVADAVGAEHYERTITAGDVLNELDRILWAMDQPSIDGVNTYFVSQTAREAGLTVALSGLGGDELFGGYHETFQGVPQTLRALNLAHRVPAGPTLARTALTHLPLHDRWTKVADALTRPPSPASAYLTRRGLFAPSEVQALVTPEVWEAALEVFDPVTHIEQTMEDGRWKREKGNKEIRDAVRNTQYAIRSTQLFSWVSCAELTNYTRNQLLRDTDVMSMAHSLEVRVPLLDHRLVEAVLGLPAAAKTNGVGPKSLLVEAVGDLLPPLVRDRREKQGFTFPFDVWLRGPLESRAVEWSHSLSSLLRLDGVVDVERAYEAGKLHWSRPWALAVLGGWLGDKG